MLHSFEAEVERELADGARYEAIRDWAGKCVGQAVRVAVHLCAMDRAAIGVYPWPREIPAEYMDAAVRLVRGLGSHALHFLSEAGADPALVLARKVLKRLQAMPAPRTLRDLHRKMMGGRETRRVERLDPPLVLLEANGFIRRREQPSSGTRGRKPSPIIELNPGLDIDRIDTNGVGG